MAHYHLQLGIRLQPAHLFSGERNNELPGLSLNPEESFLIVGIVTHFVESHHEKLCTNISNFDLLYLS